MIVQLLLGVTYCSAIQVGNFQKFDLMHACTQGHLPPDTTDIIPAHLLTMVKCNIFFVYALWPNVILILRIKITKIEH